MDNETLWNHLIAKFGPEAVGVFLSIVIAILRIYHDATERKLWRIMIEAALCGGLSLAASSGVRALGLSAEAAIFVGGAIGYLGPVSTREIAMRLFNSKVKASNE